MEKDIFAIKFQHFPNLFVILHSHFNGIDILRVVIIILQAQMRFMAVQKMHF